jgi:hypothetical protein
MLENERYTLSLLREELRETSDQADRLVRALDRLEMLAPPLPKPGAAQPKTVPATRQKGRTGA